MQILKFSFQSTHTKNRVKRKKVKHRKMNVVNLQLSTLSVAHKFRPWETAAGLR